jgi:hypothetical protein
MIRILCIALLVLISNSQCITPYLDYNNSSQSEFVNQHFGIGVSLPTNVLQFNIGFEFLSIHTHGSVHQPAGSDIISQQTVTSIPISIQKNWVFKQHINLYSGIGYKFYSDSTLDKAHVQTVESKKASNTQAIVQDYNETIESHPFFFIGFSFPIQPYLTISVAKSWQTMTNKITYTYLESYPSSQKSELKYEPITISFLYTF